VLISKYRWLVLFVSLIFLGCGGGDAETPEQNANTVIDTGAAEPDAGHAPAVPGTAAEPMPGGNPVATSPSPGAAGLGDPALGLGATPPATVGTVPEQPNAAEFAGVGAGIIQLPKKFEDWKPDDYLEAASEQSPRLELAINQLVKKSKAGDPKVVSLLREMLEVLGKGKGSRKEERGQARQKAASGAAGANPDGPAGTPATPAIPNPATPDPAASPNPADGSAAVIPKASQFITFRLRDNASTETDDEIEANPVDGALPGMEAGMMRTFKMDEVVKTIIFSLAENGSDEAWNTIKDIFQHKIKTDVDDASIVDWVLGASIENYGGRQHVTGQILWKALTAPNDLRGEIKTKGAVSPQKIQKQVYDLVIGYSAALMDRMLGVPLPVVVQGKVQPKRFQGESAVDQLRSQLQSMQSFGGPEAGSVAGAAGAEGGNINQRFEFEAPTMPADRIEQIAKLVWDPELVKLVHQRFESSTEIILDDPLLTLAGSLPLNSIRDDFHRHYQAHWELATELKPAQFQHYPAYARDPGLLVLLKQVPRQSPRVGKAKAGRAQSARSLAQGKAKVYWHFLTQYMVLSQIDRMREAAKPVNAFEQPNSAPPISLHDGAQVAAELTLEWPANLPESLSALGMAPLKLHYIRVEQDTFPKEVQRFYENQFKRSKAHQLSNGRWFEQSVVGSTSDSRKSVDILITQQEVIASPLRLANSGIGLGGVSQGKPATSTPTTDPAAAAAGAEGFGSTPKKKIFVIEALQIEIPIPKLPAKVKANSKKK